MMAVVYHKKGKILPEAHMVTLLVQPSGFGYKLSYMDYGHPTYLFRKDSPQFGPQEYSFAAEKIAHLLGGEALACAVFDPRTIHVAWYKNLLTGITRVGRAYKL